MHQLEGFQYTTSLELNMGYYTIKVSTKICDLTTIVTEFVKFRYNIVPRDCVLLVTHFKLN